MAKLYFMPATDAGKAGLLLNIANKLPGLKTTLNLTDADVTGVQADAAYFNWVLNNQVEVVTYGQEWTAYKNAARNGTGPTLGPEPVAPVIAPAPTAVAPGVIPRALALIARIKTSPGYTEAIGKSLGIIGADSTIDTTTLKPILTADLQAGQVVVGWTKQGMDGVEIHVDRGDSKGFVFLAIDTVPDYNDTAPLPATGQAALWKYMAIYRQGDDRVGQWSDVVSIAVAGK